jgi:hypothetical protein
MPVRADLDPHAALERRPFMNIRRFTVDGLLRGD